MEVKQNNLIKSLSAQPLIVVIRLEHNFFNLSQKKEDLFFKIEKLSNFGIKNIEIGWDSNPEWVNLILEIKNKFKSINLGVASISSKQSLESILALDLNYSMSPFFNKEIHLKAIKYKQLVIPGISNIENFKESINLGYKIIKIFPASKLGTNFLNQLKYLKEKDTFFIGAGGIKSKSLKKLLRSGYDALVIGRELRNQLPDKDLEIWLKDY
ncbi:bifunctional 4-hydroxy-2-oxoglutarate aldolase/2-dehydro-3-deoxy-phosphogluconate aldolase [Prochlorococcus sp. MIT 0801]|uniref:bifunctional 4-hydroxy-2-oxoglutarate aldolase/2-dehydro-3-deoxy-phosphogluconate aldolase n=1 Tax=Prochlorococcus sp. MIT 0801 TaxID=1501269 RepID=UPI0004F6834F|nr:bifunctional 4-hydroxy-2-oxoglutarate aldolase/2-dehydro-3-deoxy-phosphogluconate aldolase [Prochlorococcus sp. MIT 0801]AIQ96410.1 4-Hydroxy-2-oxoglutarate aldolase [Prochlorococcus sp. MIT 0801]